MDNFEWMKPNEIMKKRKIKSKEDLKNKSIDTSVTEPVSNKNKTKLSVRSFKRKNPFSCTSDTQDEGNTQKKTKIDCAENLTRNVFNEFSDYCVDQPIEGHTNYNTFIRNLSSRESNLVSSQKLTSEPSNKPQTSFCLPSDLSLKGRIRFTVNIPSINHILKLKSNEEAEALRLHYSQCFNGGESNMEINNHAVLFHSHLMYHIFPSIPGVNAFPRFNNSKNKVQDLVSFTKKAEQLMHQQWSNSLHSCLQTLRQRHTHLFYVCSSNCTILFTSLSGVGGIKSDNDGETSGGGDMGNIDDDIVAIITPSTKGFRKALDKEGIKYTLPLNQKKKRSLTKNPTNGNISFNNNNNSIIDNGVANSVGINTNTSTDNDNGALSSSCDSGVGSIISNVEKEVNDNDLDTSQNHTSLMGEKVDYNKDKLNINNNNNTNKDEKFNNDNEKVVSNDNNENEDEDDEDWLERLGISSINVVEETFKGKLSSSQSSEDYKRIDYRPESTVLIKNFCEVNALMNFIMNTVTMVSVGTSLPPSIISPSPFQASTLQSLKVSNKGEVIENRVKRSVFEITGPIMNMRTLCRIVSKFSTNFNVSAFSSSNSNAFNVNDDRDVDNFEELKQNTALKEIFYDMGLYSWKIA